MEALPICAAFTYGNAVYNEWTDKIKQINEEAELIIDDFNDRATDLRAPSATSTRRPRKPTRTPKKPNNSTAAWLPDGPRKQARVSRRSAADRQRELTTLTKRRRTPSAN